MIISLINQKGGVGKSALARALSVEFARNGWRVHAADLDRAQQTFLIGLAEGLMLVINLK